MLRSTCSCFVFFSTLGVGGCSFDGHLARSLNNLGFVVKQLNKILRRLGLHTLLRLFVTVVRTAPYSR